MLEWIILGAIALASVAFVTASTIKKILNKRYSSYGWIEAQVKEIFSSAYSNATRIRLDVTDDDGNVEAVYIDGKHLGSDIYRGKIIR